MNPYAQYVHFSQRITNLGLTCICQRCACIEVFWIKAIFYFHEKKGVAFLGKCTRSILPCKTELELLHLTDDGNTLYKHIKSLSRIHCTDTERHHVCITKSHFPRVLVLPAALSGEMQHEIASSDIFICGGPCCL